MGAQFKYLHLSIQFHVAKLISHTSIEHFIKEDIAISALDSHSQNALLQLIRRRVAVEAKRVLCILVVSAQLPEELL